MISLSILNQVSDKKEVRIKAVIYLILSGLLCGYVAHLL